MPMVIVNHHSASERKMGAAPRSKRKLHEHRIDPAIEFESDSTQDSGMLKAQLFMHAHGSFILTVADHGHELPAPPFLASWNQFRQQRRSNAASCMSVMHIH